MTTVLFDVNHSCHVSYINISSLCQMSITSQEMHSVNLIVTFGAKNKNSPQLCLYMQMYIYGFPIFSNINMPVTLCSAHQGLAH